MSLRNTATGKLSTNSNYEPPNDNEQTNPFNLISDTAQHVAACSSLELQEIDAEIEIGPVLPVEVKLPVMLSETDFIEERVQILSRPRDTEHTIVKHSDGKGAKSGQTNKCKIKTENLDRHKAQTSKNCMMRKYRVWNSEPVTEEAILDPGNVERWRLSCASGKRAEEKTVKCSICGLIFKKRSSLRSHTRLMHDRSLFCGVMHYKGFQCEYVAKHTFDVHKHQNKGHCPYFRDPQKRIKYRTCKWCGRVSKTKDVDIRHRRICTMGPDYQKFANVA